MGAIPALDAFRRVAPEFGGESDDTVSEWIGLTAPFVSKKKFGRLFGQALALLTAHRMKVAGVGSLPGEDPLKDVEAIGVGGLMRVGSYSEGETSIGFNSNLTQYANLNAELSLTKYGVQYLSIMRMRITSITSAGEGNGGA